VFICVHLWLNLVVIAQLRGTLIDKRPNHVLIDVAGVGYLVHIPLSTFYTLGDLHSEVTLLIYTHVREDQLSLYGFLTAREKHLFELLISASGVGPTLATKILSGMSVEELGPAIRRGDLGRLTSIPGVGRKTAERMIVELRDKLAALAAHEAAPEPTTGLEADVVSALVNLGYDRRAAERALDTTRRDGAPATFESLLRATLQQLAKPASRAAKM